MTKTPHSENTCTKTQPIIHPRNSTNLGIQKSSAFRKISPFETCIRLGVPLSRWSFVLLVKLSGWSTNPSGCSLRFLSLSTSRISKNRIVFQAYSCELFSLNWKIFVPPPQENKWWTAFLWLIVVAPELANFTVQQWFIGSSGIKTGPFPIGIVLLSWNQTSKSHLSFKSKTQNFIL